MKLAVTGKGGVGKTTVSALLCAGMAAEDYQVFAIDADPNTTLLGCLGYPHPETVRPLVELSDLIEERTGAKPGTIGGMFRLNPFVDDIPANYAVDVNGVRVLVAGGFKTGGTGCYCPENAMVRALISHLLLDKESALVIDMEAGVEHLSRGTLASIDELLIVVEPSRASTDTAIRIRRMAGEIGLHRMQAVANKVRGDADEEFIRAALADLPVAGFVPFDPSVSEAERSGRPPADASPTVDAIIRDIVHNLQFQRQAKAVSSRNCQ